MGSRDRSKTSPASARQSGRGMKGLRGEGQRNRGAGGKGEESKEAEEGGEGRGGGGRRGEATSFIYYDASCSVGLMCGEQTVFYVLILQAVCVGWG